MHRQSRTSIPVLPYLVALHSVLVLAARIVVRRPKVPVILLIEYISSVKIGDVSFTRRAQLLYNHDFVPKRDSLLILQTRDKFSL